MRKASLILAFVASMILGIVIEPQTIDAAPSCDVCDYIPTPFCYEQYQRKCYGDGCGWFGVTTIDDCQWKCPNTGKTCSGSYETCGSSCNG